LPRPFDAATRKLLEFDPPAWLARAGLTPTGPVRAIDSDVSTVTAEADTVFQVGDPAEYLAHLELQSGHERTLPRRLLHYNVLLTTVRLRFLNFDEGHEMPRTYEHREARTT